MGYRFFGISGYCLRSARQPGKGQRSRWPLPFSPWGGMSFQVYMGCALSRYVKQKALPAGLCLGFVRDSRDFCGKRSASGMVSPWHTPGVGLPGRFPREPQRGEGRCKGLEQAQDSRGRSFEREYLFHTNLRYAGGKKRARDPPAFPSSPRRNDLKGLQVLDGIMSDIDQRLFC